MTIRQKQRRDIGRRYRVHPVKHESKPAQIVSSPTCSARSTDQNAIAAIHAVAASQRAMPVRVGIPATMRGHGVVFEHQTLIHGFRSSRRWSQT